MPNMFRNFTYPGSDFHEMNLQWLFDSMGNPGLALNVSGNALRLVNSNGDVLSSVIVSYAEKALTDKNGNDISTYILSVAGVGDTIVFTKGDGTNVSLTVPYATKAKSDINGHDIEDYIYNVQVAGNKLRVTHGDGTISEITVPYALQATADEEGKDITTYAASLSAEGDAVVLRDSKGRLLSSVTVPFATKALQDVDGDAIKANYASALQTGTTTVILKAKDGSVLSTITVPYATDAGHADNADLATVATDCTNAVETVAISGDTIVFTTYGGQTFNITAPYAVKALKDDLGNQIKSTYVANVSQDAGSGVLSFYDAMGVEICHLTPVAGVAIKDDYNNNLADYIKSIVVSQNADYVTVTHGTGTTDTLTIHYSETAWKDTNDHVIKNFYIARLAIVEDVDDGHYKLVAYNGDTPEAELFRIDVIAYSAQTDINGKDLTTYVADVDYNANKQIEVTDGGGNVLKTLANKLGNLADVFFTSLANGDFLTYDAANDIWVNAELQIDLGDLYDVTLTNVQDGDILVYDSQNGIWVNQAQPTYAMSDLTDVDLTGIQNGDTLVYNSTTQEFETAPIPTPTGCDVYELYYNAEEAYVEAAISSGITNTDFDGIMAYIGQNYYGGAGQVQMTLSKIVNVTQNTANTSPSVSDLQDALIHGVCAVVLRETYNSGVNGNDLRIGTVNSGYDVRSTTLNSVNTGLYNVHGNSSNLYVTVDVVAMGGGGGSGVPDDRYIILGSLNTNSSQFTPASTSAILAKADVARECAILLNDSVYVPVGAEYIQDGISSQDIVDGHAVEYFLKKAADGLPPMEIYSCQMQFYFPINNQFAACMVSLILDNTGIYQIQGQRMF